MVTISVNGKIIEDIGLFAFDKDGTLMDLYVYWSGMVDLRAGRICDFYGLPREGHKEALMSSMGIDTNRGRLKPQGPVGLLPRGIVQKAAEDYLALLGIADTEPVCASIFREVDELSVSLFDKLIRPLDGAVELLMAVKQAGVKTAIATTDRTDRAALAARFLGIYELIDMIAGADKVRRSKPYPDMLELICGRLNVPPSQCVMIGDSGLDVEAGINAGFKASIGLCGGLAGKDVLSGLTPYVAEKLSDVKIL
ncbi:MAG: HAD family hydrolase [Candidatus Omnitrophota bacterium]